MYNVSLINECKTGSERTEMQRIQIIQLHSYDILGKVEL